MSGWPTNGATVLTLAQMRANMQVPVDTQYTGGASPQYAALNLGLLGSFMNVSGITYTAFAGGGQASATQLGYGINVVTVVATAADSVKLPPSVAGAIVFIKNADAADSTTVFGYGTDTIDGVASATGNAQAAGNGKLYFCTAGDGTGVAGTWVTLLGA